MASGVCIVVFAVAFLLSCFINSSEEYISAHMIYPFYVIISMLYFCFSFVKIKSSLIKEVTIYLYLFLLIFFGIFMLMTASSNGSVCFIIPIIILPLVIVAKPEILASIVLLGVVTAIVISGKTQTTSIHLDNVLDIIPCGVLSILMIFAIMRNRMQRFYYKFENQKLQESEQKALTKVENIEGFVNALVRSASKESDLDLAIEKLVADIGQKLNTDRVYIFERNEAGTFDDNYEWCREGVHSEKDKLKNIPYEGVIEAWYNTFDECSCVLIDDIEQYKDINKTIYTMLKEQQISSLIVHPLVIDGERIGFFGVDNPSPEMHDYIMSLLSMTEFFITAIIKVRNNIRDLQSAATYDPLTNCKNRTAMSWLLNEDFDKNKSLAVFSCDCNSLKKINDAHGHEAGDMHIIRTAEILQSVFGKEDIYRIGGDEFVVAIVGISLSEFEGLAAKAEEQLRDIAAVGYVYKEKVDTDIKHILNLVDTNMYQQKKRFYEKNSTDL